MGGFCCCCCCCHQKERRYQSENQRKRNTLKSQNINIAKPPPSSIVDSNKPIKKKVTDDHRESSVTLNETNAGQHYKELQCVGLHNGSQDNRMFNEKVANKESLSTDDQHVSLASIKPQVEEENYQKMERFLNDLVIVEILNNLSIRDQIVMKGVSKQFSLCVNHLLCIKKKLYVVISSVPNLMFDETYDNRIDFKMITCPAEEDQNALTIDKMAKYEVIFKRLENIKTIKILIHRFNDYVCRWIVRQFPSGKYELYLWQYNWSVNEFVLMKMILGNQLENIHLCCQSSPQSIINVMASRLFGLPSLRKIRFPNCVFGIPATVRNIIEMISSNIQKLSICIITDNLCHAIVTENVRHIRYLELTLIQETRETEIVATLCDRLENLITFRVNRHFNFIATLVSFQFSKTLKKVSIKSVIDQRPQVPLDFQMASSITRLMINKLTVDYNFITCLSKMFPNLQHLALGLQVRCQYQKEELNYCSVCLKKFIVECINYANTRTVNIKIINLFKEKSFKISALEERLLYIFCDLHLETKKCFDIYFDEWIFEKIPIVKIFTKLISKYMDFRIVIVLGDQPFLFTGYTFEGNEDNIKYIQFNSFKGWKRCCFGENDAINTLSDNLIITIES